MNHFPIFLRLQDQRVLVVGGGPAGAAAAIYAARKGIRTGVAAERFDLVLMDMQMPVMDGLDAMRRIRADEARLGAERTPIVMLTANTTEVHHLKAVQAGADHLVSKPVTLDILLQGMEQGAAAAAEWSGEPVLSAA